MSMSIPEKSRETIVVNLKPALAVRIREHAKEQDRSVSAERRVALKHHLDTRLAAA